MDVPAAVLEQYVGTYDLRSDAIADTPKLVKITMTEGTLFLEGRRLAPLSTTRFHGSSEVEFFTNTQGEVTQMVIQTAGGARVARRVRDAR